MELEINYIADFFKAQEFEEKKIELKNYVCNLIFILFKI